MRVLLEFIWKDRVRNTVFTPMLVFAVIFQVASTAKAGVAKLQLCNTTASSFHATGNFISVV
jgi:hypothetical protein